MDACKHTIYSVLYNIPLDPAISCALWLRKQREARNLTMTDVAKKLGVKYQVYQKLENPKTANPTLKTIRKLENVFETELICS
jgi:antitoxin HicB